MNRCAINTVGKERAGVVLVRQTVTIGIVRVASVTLAIAIGI
jgi:hypothetical protein